MLRELGVGVWGLGVSKRNTAFGVRLLEQTVQPLTAWISVRHELSDNPA